MIYSDPNAQSRLLSHISSSLSEGGIRQFKRSLARGRLGLFETHYLLGQYPETVYVPLLSTNRVPGHYQPAVEDAVREWVEGGEGDLREAFANVQYITNPLLRPVDHDPDNPDEPVRLGPSARATNSGFVILTIEFDDLDLGFFEEQLTWCRPRGPKQKLHDCPIGELDGDLAATYRDYRGVVAVYSGSKSIHFHFIFNTIHLNRELQQLRSPRPDAFVADLPTNHFSELVRQRWDHLAGIFRAKFSVQRNMDTSLGRYAQLRRAPWGLRQAGTNHLLGVPEGTLVPQLVLLDLSKKRSLNRSGVWFMDPADLNLANLKIPASRRRLDPEPMFCDPDQIIDDMTEALSMYWGTEYPKPVRFEKDGDGYRLRFQNSATDPEPGSFVRDDFNELKLQGSTAPTGSFNLPTGLTLAEFIEDVRSTRRRSSSTTAKKIPRDRSTRGSAAGGLYRLAVQRSRDLPEIRDHQTGFMRHLIQSNRPVVLHGPEGSGKTSFWIRELPWRRLEYDRGMPKQYDAEHLGFMVFAARSYDQARAKHQEFRTIHGDGPFKGLLLRGFSDLFKEQTGRPVSPSEAAAKGHDSVVTYVEQEFPDAYQAMVEIKNAAWADAGFDPSHTMLFTAQALVHDFNQNSRTRAWLHPEYEAHKEDQDAWRALSRGLSFSHLIHDELEINDLVHCFLEGDVAMARKVEIALGGDWHDPSLTNQYNAYVRVAANHSSMIPFENVLEINRARPSDEDHVVVDTSKQPLGRSTGSKDVYQQVNGSCLFVVPRRWWCTFGDQCTTIMLTTEDLPCQIAERIMATNKMDQILREFRVLRSERPVLIEPVPVNYVTDNLARRSSGKRKGVDALVEKLQVLIPDLKVITNYADTIPNGINHMSAKGSNDLDQENLGTIITFPAKELYAELCAIARRFDIDYTVKTSFRDQVFQAIGRNKGFRGDHDRGHVVVIHPGLEDKIDLKALTAGRRYELRRAASYRAVLNQFAA
jgi:hypothetical protein